MSIDSNENTAIVSSCDDKTAAKCRAQALRKEAYQRAKERKKAYLASPEVRARIMKQRSIKKNARQEYTAKARLEKSNRRKIESQDVKNAKQELRSAKVSARDEELHGLVRPGLTLLKGGLSL
ncbi:MAG: hypothetical protein NTV34_09745 [Proteobacteria bacterium]|nr:hypothetical protein [Pseudomonadota bacterium]